jgi:ATP-dependent Clp protease ATP-binding subunit ClpC
MIDPRHNLTDRSRKVVRLAQAAATRLGHDAATPVHLGLGLIEEGEGVAAAALLSHGFDFEDLARELTHTLPTASVRPQRISEIAFTEDGKDVLARADVEAQELGHPYVGTEHLLLALLRERTSAPAEVLARHGFRHADAMARVRWILEADPRDPKPYVPPPAI